MTQSILVIDDNEGVLTALSVLFSVHDLHCVTATSAEEGLQTLATESIGLVVQDMNFSNDTTSGKEGIELFHQLRHRNPDLPIILLTAWTHLETAVQLVRDGAADYLSKPWDDDKLIATARNLLELSEASERHRTSNARQRAQRSKLAENYDLCGTIYESVAMHELIAVAVKVAPSDLPVMITGPNGAGKEKIADIVHANSNVANGPLIKVNVGALPADLLEGELFGAEVGAYTGSTKARIGHFESAHNGTLFLDEIANLSLDGQAKLLRVLQTGEFQRLGSSQTHRKKVRVLSATNTDLLQAVADGSFREDLYYRLNVIQLELPALRDRPEDILPLAYHFIAKGKSFSTDAEAALSRHTWSGNVRELENCIKRASLLAPTDVLDTASLALPVQNTDEPKPAAFQEPDRQTVEAALKNADGTIAKAARELGLSRQALYRRMKKFDIQK